MLHIPCIFLIAYPLNNIKCNMRNSLQEKWAQRILHSLQFLALFLVLMADFLKGIWGVLLCMFQWDIFVVYYANSQIVLPVHREREITSHNCGVVHIISQWICSQNNSKFKGDGLMIDLWKGKWRLIIVILFRKKNWNSCKYRSHKNGTKSLSYKLRIHLL